MGRGDRTPDLLRLLSGMPQGISCQMAADRLGIQLRSIYRLRDRALQQGYDLEARPGWLKLREDQAQTVTLTPDGRIRAAILASHLKGPEASALRKIARSAELPVAVTAQAHAGDLGGDMIALMARLSMSAQLCLLTLDSGREITGTACGVILDRHAYAVIRQDCETRHLRLDRIISAKEVEGAAERKEFDLDAYIGSGWSAWGWGKEACEVRLLADPAVAPAIGRTARHATQRCWEDEEGFHVQLDVHPCRELLGWILGYAGQLQVVSPESLRTEVAGAARKLLERHQSIAANVVRTQ